MKGKIPLCVCVYIYIRFPACLFFFPGKINMDIWLEKKFALFTPVLDSPWVRWGRESRHTQGDILGSISKSVREFYGT